jgi:hypothetical protein
VLNPGSREGSVQSAGGLAVSTPHQPFYAVWAEEAAAHKEKVCRRSSLGRPFSKTPIGVSKKRKSLAGRVSAA